MGAVLALHTVELPAAQFVERDLSALLLVFLLIDVLGVCFLLLKDKK